MEANSLKIRELLKKTGEESKHLLELNKKKSTP